MSNLDRRLQVLEDDPFFGAGGMEVIDVSGGLARGVSGQALVSGERLLRATGEADPAWRGRVMRIAAAKAARLVVFGGLPDDDDSDAHDDPGTTPGATFADLAGAARPSRRAMRSRPSG